MKIYLGQTRSKTLITELEGLSFGECTCRGELPPRRTGSGWFYDNGAFGDWQAGRQFDLNRFYRDIESIERGQRGYPVARTFPQPDFLVLPDLVGAGLQSLQWSLDFLDGFLAPFHGYPAPVYLAVQDGMSAADVRPHLERVAGLFVGGSLEWKLETAPTWLHLAHASGIPCHVGRVGTADRVRWALDIGADSIDSCLPLWSQGHLSAFVQALHQPQATPRVVEQLALFAPVGEAA